MDKRRDELKKTLVYNHFENISVLSSKTGLLKTLRDFYSTNKEAKLVQYKVEDTLPMAYIITSNPTETEFMIFKKKFNQIERGVLSSTTLPPKHF